MNNYNTIVLAKGQDVTADVLSYQYNGSKCSLTFKNGKRYDYDSYNVTIMQNGKAVDSSLYRLNHNGRELFKIKSISIFSNNRVEYWKVVFEDGSVRNYERSTLKVVKSCLDDKTSKDCLDYLKRIAELNELKAEDGTKLLSHQYSKILYVGENTVLARYLNPKNIPEVPPSDNVPIYPFGCNSSQFDAVKKALDNQISVIQGPPGTGKTQTILNIIANLVADEKTVLVVSNNNSATANVLEKLSSEKYGLGFIAAQLGSTDNKAQFVKNQTGLYPNLLSWKSQEITKYQFDELMKSKGSALKSVFEEHNRLAQLKQEMSSLNTEYEHFKIYLEDNKINFENSKIRKSLKSAYIINLLQKCVEISEQEGKISLAIKLKSIFKGIPGFSFFKRDISIIISELQFLFYETRIRELTEEIDTINKSLASKNASDMISEYTDISLSYLRNVLYHRYGNQVIRDIFTLDDLYKKPGKFLQEYPVILSTTFSAISSLSNHVVYDYVIIDEASQVDIATGALALSCARNVVIVGDEKQLPNVVSDADRAKAEAVFSSYKLNSAYDYASNSFLGSIIKVFPDVAQTLLREHYRCHPKIIDFCNQKFYNGNLLIMMEDNGEGDALTLVRTVKGDHARGRLNQRQIDVITEEILPDINVDDSEIGIIAPYNEQVDKIKSDINNDAIQVSTVHKFQGREKDAIILSTVDDVVKEFTDNPNLLNVAVSRAVKKFYLVSSANNQPADSNIADLMAYIEYNNLEIVDSQIRSVFDYLYSQYTKERLEYLSKQKKVSEYDSENLMYALIIDVLSNGDFSGLNVVCHIPLNLIVRSTEMLNEREKKYATNPATHIDFLIYNKVSKKLVLAVEVDGYSYHKAGTEQAERDKMKNHILDSCGIPYIRFSTNGSNEKEKLVEKLKNIIA